MFFQFGLTVDISIQEVWVKQAWPELAIPGQVVTIAGSRASRTLQAKRSVHML